MIREDLSIKDNLTELDYKKTFAKIAEEMKENGDVECVKVVHSKTMNKLLEESHQYYADLIDDAIEMSKNEDYDTIYYLFVDINQHLDGGLQEIKEMIDNWFKVKRDDLNGAKYTKNDMIVAVFTTILNTGEEYWNQIKKAFICSLYSNTNKKKKLQHITNNNNN